MVAEQKRVKSPVKYLRWSALWEKLLTIFVKRSILDVWQDPEYVTSLIELPKNP